MQTLQMHVRWSLSSLTCSQTRTLVRPGDKRSTPAVWCPGQILPGAVGPRVVPTATGSSGRAAGVWEVLGCGSQTKNQSKGLVSVPVMSWIISRSCGCLEIVWTPSSETGSLLWNSTSVVPKPCVCNSVCGVCKRIRIFTNGAKNTSQG